MPQSKGCKITARRKKTVIHCHSTLSIVCLFDDCKDGAIRTGGKYRDRCMQNSGQSFSKDWEQTPGQRQ